MFKAFEKLDFTVEVKSKEFIINNYGYRRQPIPVDNYVKDDVLYICKGKNKVTVLIKESEDRIKIPLTKEQDKKLELTPHGNVKIDVCFQDETVWLTQKKMSELFYVNRSVISKHLKNIFSEGELIENAVCAIFAHTALDEKTYNVNFYNLDAIISVGYQVSSSQATQFRIWAKKVLREYIIKCFAIYDERLKNGNHFGKDYFEELLENPRNSSFGTPLFIKK